VYRQGMASGAHMSGWLYNRKKVYFPVTCLDPDKTADVYLKRAGRKGTRR